MLGLLGDLRDAVLAIPHVGLFVTLGWIGYVLVLGGWIVQQKREPLATLSWLVSLAALPYLGFVIYYFLGPLRIRRTRLHRVRARAALPAPPPGLSPTPDAIELARLGQAATGLPPTTATRVELLVDGGATYDALLTAIAGARDHVHLEYYIYEPDRIGTAVRDALVERARAGVRVRLLLDAMGSRRVSRRFLRPLLEAGGEHAWFHPVQLPVLWRRPWLNLRTHRKLVVIDGALGFTGGINVSDDQDERVRPGAYRDLHVRLEGDVVQALAVTFLEDWAYATGRPAPAPLRPTPQPGTVASQVLVSGPDSSLEAIHRMHVSAIHAAVRRVWLVTPYFVPGEAARMALTSAALGGLDVRVLVPRRTDSLLVTYAARSYFDELLAAGVGVYEYGPRLLHTKALLCDDDLAIVGSANFDHRSFRLNFEMSVMFRDVGVASALAALLDHECSVSVLRARAPASWRRDLPEGLARLMSPLL